MDKQYHDDIDLIDSKITLVSENIKDSISAKFNEISALKHKMRDALDTKKKLRARAWTAYLERAAAQKQVSEHSHRADRDARRHERDKAKGIADLQKKYPRIEGMVPGLDANGENYQSYADWYDALHPEV